jgi:hypothetical protein
LRSAENLFKPGNAVADAVTGMIGQEHHNETEES